MTLPTVLIVDLDAERAWRLAHEVEAVADVEVATDFASARASLQTTAPAFLVTNLRLGAYNGLHLVYTAASANLPVRSVVYTETHTPGLAVEVELASATYETFDHLVSNLSTYITTEQPVPARRDSWENVLEYSQAVGARSGRHHSRTIAR